MTPYAMKIARAMMTAPRPETPESLRAMLGMACFDMTQVKHVIAETEAELVAGMKRLMVGNWLEHGGLLFLPASPCWFEERWQTWRRGCIVEQLEGYGLSFTAFDSARPSFRGLLQLDPDGEHFGIYADADEVPRPDIDDAHITAVVAMGLFLAASLLLTNAPRGVERRSVEPHRGFAREARRAVGPMRLRPSYIIELSTTPQQVGEPSGPGYSGPKAFHFCRSHLRRLPGGVMTRVRAHWRGDPSLGVCHGEYRLTGAPQLAGDA